MRRQLELREEKSFGMKKGVSVLLRNLSHLPVYVRGELHMRNRRDSRASFLLLISIPMILFVEEFVARIDAGSAKGWIQILKEQDFIDGCSAKDGWVTLATNIALLTPKDFENTTVPIAKHLTSDMMSEIDVQDSRLTVESELCHITIEQTILTCSMVEGDAVTDGIKHAHMITKDTWCASYKVSSFRSFIMRWSMFVRAQWFVHRSLLEMTNKAIFTNPFGVDETQWCERDLFLPMTSTISS